MSPALALATTPAYPRLAHTDDSTLELFAEINPTDPLQFENASSQFRTHLTTSYTIADPTDPNDAPDTNEADNAEPTTHAPPIANQESKSETGAT